MDPAVLEAMLPYLRDHFANPSASYRPARTVQRAVQAAREQVATLIGAGPEEIVFTSGGTEADNAAINSARLYWPQRRHLVIATTEHSAVIEPARRWEEDGGMVTRVPVGPDGLISLDALRLAVRPGETALVSIMWANNETGVIAPIEEIARVAHEAGALMHTDAVQAAGKLAIHLRSLPIDLLSLSGHKMHAPKGIGALFVSKRVRFQPSMLGGGQEQERRGGTENVPGIIALGKAAELATAADQAAIAVMRDLFEARLQSVLPGVSVNGHAAPRLAGTSSLSFPGIAAAEMLILLDERGVCCSAGAACHAANAHPSHVLEAMGLDAGHAACTLRFSFSRFTTVAEVREAAGHVIAAAGKLQAMKADEEGPVVLSSPHLVP